MIVLLILFHSPVRFNGDDHDDTLIPNGESSWHSAVTSANALCKRLDPAHELTAPENPATGGLPP